MDSGIPVPRRAQQAKLIYTGRPAPPGCGLSLQMCQDSFLQVPEGFVITTRTYHDLVDHNNLRPLLDSFSSLLADSALDSTVLDGMRKKLEREILQADPPPKLLGALEAAVETMAAGADTSFFLAVRSSAQEEDMDFSFAGQFRSVLNVRARSKDIFQAYLNVVASLFSMEAVSYSRQVLPNDRQMSMVSTEKATPLERDATMR